MEMRFCQPCLFLYVTIPFLRLFLASFNEKVKFIIFRTALIFPVEGISYASFLVKQLNSSCLLLRILTIRFITKVYLKIFSPRRESLGTSLRYLGQR